MKKLLLFAFLFTSFIGFSQTDKGRFIVSGSAGFQINAGTTKVEFDGEEISESKHTTIQFTPTFGYFVIDNLAVGLSASISSSTEKEGDDKYNTTGIGVAPTVMYFFPIEGKIRPFVQAAVGYTSTTTKYTPDVGPDSKSTFGGLMYGGGGGVAFFINDNVSFNAGLTYTGSSMKDSDAEDLKLKQGNISGILGITVYFK